MKWKHAIRKAHSERSKLLAHRFAIGGAIMYAGTCEPVNARNKVRLRDNVVSLQLRRF
jgi:hypothetical protein